MEKLDDLAPQRLPTPNRPLLGMTILAVEDSRHAGEALRLMCLRSGARIRRADCLRAARRHLQVYRPSAMIVDLGLPDGSGLDLIAEMHRARPRIGVLFGLSGDAAAARDVIAAGADGFLAKPLDSLAAFQREILARLPEERHPAGPRPIDDAPIRPDPLALWQDLRQAEALLQDGEVATLRYAAQFLGSLARATAEAELAAVADDVIAQGAMGAPARARLRGVAGAMRQRIDRAAGP